MWRQWVVVLYSLEALLYSFKCACALKKKANESCSPHYRQCCNTGRVVTVCKMRETQPNAKIKTSGEAKSKQSIMEKEQGVREQQPPPHGKHYQVASWRLHTQKKPQTSIFLFFTLFSVPKTEEIKMSQKELAALVATRTSRRSWRSRRL